MSLLLDALKRAEEAKRAKLTVESGPDAPDTQAITPAIPGTDSGHGPGDDEPAAQDADPPDFSLEDYKEVIPAKSNSRLPVAAPPAAGEKQRGAELSLENLPGARSAESVEENRVFATARMATPASPSKLDATEVDAAQSRDTARNMFTAKQVTSPDAGSRKKWLLPVIAVVVLAVGVGGWYVWNEINRISRPAAANVLARPAPTSTLPPAQLATGQPGARQQVDPAPKSEAPVEAPLPPLLPPPAEQSPLPKLALLTPAKSAKALTQREVLAKALKETPASKPAPVELKLARSVDAPAVSADLVDAYAALANGDYPRARALYASLVLADPLNPDAQLGMATALARSGDTDAAMRHYRQVLVIDPRNGLALAGLLAVSDAKSPSLEGELRTLAGRNPETSSLRFALGNLYASERRWVEAQQAYFEAYRIESDNADYMYNLAVSLDQLKQPKLARDYYQKALAAGLKTGGQFDRATVTRRIKDLAADPGHN